MQKLEVQKLEVLELEVQKLKVRELEVKEQEIKELVPQELEVLKLEGGREGHCDLAMLNDEREGCLPLHPPAVNVLLQYLL